MNPNAALGAAAVTGIEAIAFYAGVHYWFAVSPFVGVVVWTLITYVEHFVAQNLGWGNLLFHGFPFSLRRPSA